MSIDSAIIELLDLNADKSSVRSAGGSGASGASTLRIDTTDADGEKSFFVKIASGTAAQYMFAGEHASLNAIADAVPGLAPKSFGHGSLSDRRDASFIVTEFIDMTPSRAAGKGKPLASKLAELHLAPAPIPAGFDRPQYGFPTPTCCGETRQPNPYTSSWADFFAKHRLGFIADESVKRQGRDPDFETVTKPVCAQVIPRLLGSLNIDPVVVHGDLWSGNRATGRLPGKDTEELVYDPSGCYAHSEYDLGIMRMFGGFGTHVFEAYHELCPKTEPVEEYEDRLALYEAYHHLNHYAMFGGGYKHSGMRILRGLIDKYG